ncbi:MAG: DMT family transporter [Bacteroidales bacterium]
MERKEKFINWFILVILALIWGSSFILIKRGLRSFSSFQVASLRVFITYLVLLPVSLKHLSRINRGNILSLIIIGVIGNAFPAFLYPAAQVRIDSTTAGMLNSLTPVFTLLIGVLIYRRSATWRQVTGIILGPGRSGRTAFIINSSRLKLQGF